MTELIYISRLNMKAFLLTLSLLLVSTLAFASDFYWVGDSGNWSDYAHHWATTSGGSTFYSNAPTSSDNVHFDANSFTAASQTVTVDATANCNNMDWTGATNTPTFTGPGYTFSQYIYGSLTFITNMTVTQSTQYLIFSATSTGKTITMAGKIPLFFYFSGVGGGWTLQDNVVGNYFALTNGTLVTNDKSLTFYNQFAITGTALRTLTLGNSTITLSCNWDATNITNLTLTPSTSTINCSGNFTGGGITTYNIVNLTGATSTISGSNTFAQLNLASGTTQTITFTDGTTQTISGAATLSGSSGHVHTLQGSSTAGWAITKSGGGVASQHYISISHSTGSPASTWFADSNSTNGGNNSGWTIGVPAIIGIHSITGAQKITF